MALKVYICPVCGKEIKRPGTQSIKLHERSAFHKAAMEQASEQHKPVMPVPSIEPETVPEIKGIQTTVMENNNVKNKETTDRNEGNEGSTDDTDEFTGYLC